MNATGIDLQYQWFRIVPEIQDQINGPIESAIPGATSNTYTTPPLEKTTTYVVRIRGCNAPYNGSSASAQAVLTVTKTPLIFIPGVAGSQLGETVQNVPPFPPFFLEYWLNPSEFTSLSRLTLDPNKTQYPTIHTNDILRKVGALGFEDDQYDGLIKALVNRGGYREYKIDGKLERLTTAGCDDVAQGKDNPNLFIFPYDWRRSNAENAVKLKDYVGCVKKFYKDSKVDILTHSMGSLLARRYVLDNPGTHNVDKHVSIGAPWLGAAKFLATMEYGLFLENPKVADKILGPPLKSLVEFFPGPHELMPSRAYFQLGGRPFATHDLRTVPTNFRQFETWDELSQYVDGQFARSKPATANDLFHNNIMLAGQDDWSSDQSGVKYFHIIGRQKAPSTISQVVKKLVVRCGLGGLCSAVTEYDTLRGAGDGTVPELSAARKANGFPSLNAPTATLVTFCGGDSKEAEENVSHTKLVLYPLVQDQVISLLRGSTEILGCESSAAAATKGAAALTGSEGLAYYINVFGADTNSVNVADSSGVSTTATADYPLGRDVPGVTYNMLGAKDVSLILNRNETYTVTFIAAAEPLVVRATLGTGNGVTQAVRYQDLVLPAGVKAVIKTGPNGIEGLKYDANADGTFETSVPPSASVTGPAAQDTEAPIVTISENRQSQNVTSVTVAATDSGSGIKKINYSLDGTNYQTYSAPFSVDPYRVRRIFAFADDNVANRSGLVEFQLTAPPPVVMVEQGTTNRAVALDSVNWLRAPFPILNDFNFSADRRTRTILFISGLALTSSDSSILTVQAAGFALPVENVGTVTGTTGLNGSYIVVKLPDGLPSGDLPLTIGVGGVLNSNPVTLGISP